MNDYELICVFETKGTHYPDGLVGVREKILAQGAKIEKEEDMGDRQLAYLIRKEDRGHYHLFTINSPPEALVKLDEILKLQAGLLRFLTIRKEEPRKIKPKKERPPKPVAVAPVSAE